MNVAVYEASCIALFLLLELIGSFENAADPTLHLVRVMLVPVYALPLLVQSWRAYTSMQAREDDPFADRGYVRVATVLAPVCWLFAIFCTGSRQHDAAGFALMVTLAAIAGAVTLFFKRRKRARRAR